MYIITLIVICNCLSEPVDHVQLAGVLKITRDEPIFCFSLTYFSFWQFFFSSLLCSIFCSKFSYIASYLTVTSYTYILKLYQISLTAIARLIVTVTC